MLNVQFYRFINWMREHMSTSETFFYMEGDTVPTQPGWLDAIRAEADARRPFAVLGSRYTGHNWDDYLNSSSPGAEPVVPLSLQLHINGNAIYNVSHPFVMDVVDRELSLGFDGVPHSSFDVRFCEVAVHEQGHTEATLEQLGYKHTDVMSNFAGTLTLSDRVPATAVLLHGAWRVEHWATRASLPENDAAGISLVVSDWGDTSSVAAFVASLNNVQGTPLPFTGMIVISQNESTAAADQVGGIEC